jgi:hypothetical protein
MDSEELSSLLDAVVQLCLDLFGTERVEVVLLHGSAFKGGAIPGYSDIDLHVYLTPDCFGPDGRLPDETIFAFQESFSLLPWNAAYYPQVFFLDRHRLPDGWIGPPADTYRELYGALPASLRPTDEQIREGARQHLRDLPRHIASTLDGYIDDTARTVTRRLRLLGTVVTPTIFALLAHAAGDPASVWAQSKFEALKQLEGRYARTEGPPLARSFYEQVASIYRSPEVDVQAVQRAFRTGVTFARWAESVSRTVAG